MASLPRTALIREPAMSVLKKAVRVAVELLTFCRQPTSSELVKDIRLSEATPENVACFL